MDFFGFGGYERTPEGFLSWQHLLFVTSYFIIAIVLAALLGLKNRNKDLKTKNKVLVITAIIMDSIEIAKIILFSFRAHDPLNFVNTLPLYLCSIQLITIPLAAFGKGRLKEAALDFVFIFGLLGAAAGTYGAGNNFKYYPILSVDIVVSCTTHWISGFSALYIGFSHMESMKKNNIWIVLAILYSFALTAYIVDISLDKNYMFLITGKDTPYAFFYAMVNGNRILYPMVVMLLFMMYIGVFYLIYYLIVNKAKKQNIKGN